MSVLWETEGVHTLRAAGSYRRDGTPFEGRGYATAGRNCLPYSSLGRYALDTLIDVRSRHLIPQSGFVRMHTLFPTGGATGCYSRQLRFLSGSDTLDEETALVQRVQVHCHLQKETDQYPLEHQKKYH
ncbi:hypothetical protein ATANTOWER_021008 [Ataeniobius toweri]|uniref:Uncharacterized protein n=1 Tax=Ataeniobius toweri TaxID=208326 RepID=A0ABU7A7H1_9TELE|nr:hypothetical protein [Ataeniobius toweri]